MPWSYKNKDKLTPTRCSELVVDVLEAKCHYCSSKPCLLFGPFEHKSLQQRRIVQCKKVNCEVVSGHQFSEKMIQFCVGEDLAFLTVDFTFHGRCVVLCCVGEDLWQS